MARRTPATVASDAGSQHVIPEHDTEHDVDGLPRDATQVRDHQHGEDCGGTKERRGIGGVAVEETDHEHGAKIVGDRERAEKDGQRRRHARPEQREHAQCEGDVGGGGDSPPRFTRPTAIERHVQQRRCRHPTECGQ